MQTVVATCVRPLPLLCALVLRALGLPALVLTALVLPALVVFGGAVPSAAYGPFPPASDVMVDAANPGVGDGSAANPYASIQDGLDAALPGDRVGVAAGTYLESVVMQDGVDLVGSGPDQTIVSDPVPLDVTVRCANDALLEGFWIRGATQPDGAVTCSGTLGSVIRGNRISENQVPGIRLDMGADARIEANEIVAESQFVGSCPCDGIVVYEASAEIVANSIDGTDPNGNLYAIRVDQPNGVNGPTSFVIERNRILGSIFLDTANPSPTPVNVIRSNLILSANGYSDALNAAVPPGTVQLVDNTLIGSVPTLGNSPTDPLYVVVANNIIAFSTRTVEFPSWIDTSAIFNNDFFGNGTSASSGSITAADLDGVNGNQSADPGFADAAGGDYRLAEASPVIDAGSASGVELGALDLDGNDRVVDGDGNGTVVVDIGAYEAVPEPREAILAMTAMLCVGLLTGSRRRGGSTADPRPGAGSARDPRRSVG